MKLWSCSMHDADFGGTMLLGIFSTKEKAEEQARVYVEGVTKHKGEVVDRSVDGASETIYYRAKNGKFYDHYNAYIEDFTLDELSY